MGRGVDADAAARALLQAEDKSRLGCQTDFLRLKTQCFWGGGARKLPELKPRLRFLSSALFLPGQILKKTRGLLFNHTRVAPQPTDFFHGIRNARGDGGEFRVECVDASAVTG